MPISRTQVSAVTLLSELERGSLEELLAVIRRPDIERGELREERDDLRAQLELRNRALEATETH